MFFLVLGFYYVKSLLCVMDKSLLELEFLSSIKRPILTNYVIDRVDGVTIVCLLAPRSVCLPTTISLPNLLINKPLDVQKVYYEGLLDEYFVCNQFGHLG